MDSPDRGSRNSPPIELQQRSNLPDGNHSARSEYLALNQQQDIWERREPSIASNTSGQSRRQSTSVNIYQQYEPLDATHDTPADFHVFSVESDTENKVPRTIVEHGRPQQSDVPAKTFPWSLTASVDDWWALEIIALCVSAGLLGAIAILVSRYDDRPQVADSSLSLNAMVSWLGTLAKAFMLVPVARSLGQLKWTWFADRPRTLADLQSFDAASRGLIGSVQLLCSKRCWHLQSIGCVATILAIGFGPFLQNLIRYDQGVVYGIDDMFTMSSSSYDEVGLTRVGSDDADSTHFVDPDLKANVYNALFNTDSGKPWAIPRHYCRADCTFEPFLTLAAEAQCYNLTDTLRVKCRDDGSTDSYLRNCTVSIGEPEKGGLSLFHEMGLGNNSQQLVINTTAKLSTVHGGRNATPDLPIIQYIKLKDPPTAGSTDAYMYLTHHNNKFPGGPNEFFQPFDNGTKSVLPYIAAECEIKLGIQGVHERILNSNYQTTDIEFWRYGDTSSSTLSPSGWGSDPDFRPWWEGFTKEWDSMTEKDLRGDDGTEDHSVLMPKGFDFHYASVLSMKSFLKAMFVGTGYGQGSWQVDNGASTDATFDTLQSLSRGYFSGCTINDDDLYCAINNVAKAMTKTFRDSASATGNYGKTGTFKTIQGSYTPGKSVSYKNFVRIDYIWMTLPVCIWIMAATLWIGTAIQTRRAKVPAWANNILPLLYLYRDEQSDDQDGNGARNGMTNAEYVRKTGEVRARLRVSGGNARLIEARSD